MLSRKKNNQRTHIITGVIISSKERSRYYYIAEDVGGVPTCLFWWFQAERAKKQSDIQ